VLSKKIRLALGDQVGAPMRRVSAGLRIAVGWAVYPNTVRQRLARMTRLFGIEFCLLLLRERRGGIRKWVPVELEWVRKWIPVGQDWVRKRIPVRE
jgi:hypothetical protein